MTLRVGIVGCGAVVRRSHLPALRLLDDVEVVRFAGGSQDSAMAARDQWGGGEVDQDWRTTVEDDQVDVVLVATPNRDHMPIALGAIGAGKHVVVESPVALTLDDADQIARAGHEAGVLAVPAHAWRSHPNHLTMREVVRSGRIGEVVGARLAWGHAGPEDWEPTATWYRDPEVSGGGALLDCGLPAIDLLRWIVGAEVTEVEAMVAPSGGRIDESAHVLVRVGDEVLASVHASWTARPGPDHQVTVLGTEGTVHGDAFTLPVLARIGGRPERLDVPRPTTSFLGAVVDAVRGGAPAPAEAEDGRAALAAVLAAYASAASGRATRPG